jgi:hypothetical protein
MVRRKRLGREALARELNNRAPEGGDGGNPHPGAERGSSAVRGRAVPGVADAEHRPGRGCGFVGARLRWPPRRGSRAGSAQDGQQFQFHPTVPFAPGFAVVGNQRLGLAVAYGDETARRYPGSLQPRADGAGSLS